MDIHCSRHKIHVHVHTCTYTYTHTETVTKGSSLHWGWILPGLSLQELLVQVEVWVAHCQQTHTLHPHPSLTFTLNQYLLKTAQAKQLALFEVTNQTHKQTALSQSSVWYSTTAHTHIKSLGMLWEPLAMHLNSIPSRSTSSGYFHSTTLPG